MDLIAEEWEEVDAELFNLLLFAWNAKPSSKRILTKELADLVYVAYGTADALGIDLGRALKDMHRSNISKLVDPVTRTDCKVLKGPPYTPSTLDWMD